VSRSNGPRFRSVARRSSALALAVALGLLTACSSPAETTGSSTSSAATSAGSEAPSAGSTPTGSADAGETRTVTATEGEMFIKLSEDSFSAGSYTFEVVNSGSATHNFMVERDGNKVAGTESISPGSSTTLTVDLEPGQYVFYCSIDNHRAMGMEVKVMVS
jgi:plastocyanin